MLFNILLLNYITYLIYSYKQRRQRLEIIVRPLPGRVEISSRIKINFIRPRASKYL